ncbi:MAG: cytochrome c oxidase subunit [Chloroflexota bacterium]|nr:cytochrome c oxidase subunit [Chloroflexota bacterium]
MTGHAEVVVPHADADVVHGASGHEQHGTDTALMGMLLFIASEIMFFAALFGAYFNVRATAQVWPPEGTEFIDPIGLPIIATVLLVSSSFTMQWGIWRIRKGDRTGMNRAVALTLLMGVIFLGIQAFDYYTLVQNDAFGINSGVYGTLFYTMTGFHGAHVLGGVIGLAVILSRGVSGQFSAKHHVAVEAVSAYWHFVDVVWVALFATIYLLK